MQQKSSEKCHREQQHKSVYGSFLFYGSPLEFMFNTAFLMDNPTWPI